MNASSIPHSVKQHLDQKGINYQSRPLPTNETLLKVEVSVLKDAQGMLQVFFPSDCIIDLKKIEQNLGRKMQAVPSTQLDELKRRQGLENLPALAGLLNIETVVDKRLTELDEFNLYSGSSEFLLSVQSQGFTEQANIVDVCHRVPFDDIDYELSLFDHDRAEIEKAVENFTNLRIRQRLEETLEIPPLPESAQAIIRLRVDPNADINKLSRIVENDPSLAAQVVSWASSSYYSAPGSVKSVQDAIIRVLGYDLVMNLALGLALGKTLDLPKDGPEGITPYWSQAVYSAAVISGLQNLIPRELRPSFGLSYLSGLLHNFGYLVLAHAFPPHFENCSRNLEANRHMSNQHVEKHLLGITREQIGSNLLKSWNLPDEVTYGVRYQNESAYQGPQSDYANLTYLANRLLWQYRMVSGPLEVINPEVFEQLHINPGDVPEMMDQIIESKSELDAIAQGIQV